MNRNPGTLGSGSVANTPAMVMQVRCTGARVGVDWKVGVPRACAGAVGMAGDEAGGDLIAPCCLVPVVPDWQACVGARLIRAACLILCWGSRCYLSTWTCKRETEDAKAMMLSRIWSI